MEISVELQSTLVDTLHSSDTGNEKAPTPVFGFRKSLNQ